MFNLEIINYGNPKEDTIGIDSVVRLPTEYLRYSKYIDDRSIPINYIESDLINVEENLNINSLSWRVIKNNPNYLQSFKNNLIETKSFLIPFRDILITNIVSFSKNGEEIPLFFKHRRKVKEASLHIVKLGDGYQIEEGYIVDENEIYTNYQNYFEAKTGKYVLYFVNGVDLEGNSFNELLDLVPVFQEASWENIDPETGEIEDSFYTKSEEGTNFFYNVFVSQSCKTSNITDKLYISFFNENLIALKMPSAISLNDTWNIRVTNGVVFDSGKKYLLPEYRTQAFDPEFGILKQSRRYCYYLQSNTIKLPEENISFSKDKNTYIDVFIHDSEENILKVVTNNPTLIGTKYEDLEYQEGIVSVDQKNGIVELDFTVDPSQIIESNFYYYTKDLVIRDIDLNPFYNEEMLYKKVYFYLKPNQANKSVYYFVLDEDDRINYASDNDLQITLNGSFNTNTLIGESINTFKEQYCYGFENDFKYMELGEVWLQEDNYLDEVLSFPIKEKTYTKSSQYESAIKRQWKLLQSKFGYGELGQVVQKNNILYIEAPLELLTKYERTKEEVEDLLRTNLTGVTDIVVEYVWPKSKIDFDLTNEGEVGLSISWEEPGSYEIYRGLNKQDKNLIHSITSSVEEDLSYTDSDVVSGKRYYYWVKINEHLYSDTFGVQVR